MEELKQCPFCGGKARIRQDKTDGIQYRGMFPVFFHVECEGCGARGKTYYAAFPFVDKGENAKLEGNKIRDAVESWNYRTAETETKTKKPAWIPMRGTDGKLFGRIAFCPHCGMILSQFDIDGKKIGEKACRNCGTEITWEETQEEYPHKFGLNLGEWLNQDDL